MVKTAFISPGLLLKKLPEAQWIAPTICLKFSFHLSPFLFIQDKDLKTKWNFNKTVRKPLSRCLVFTARQQHKLSFESPAVTFSQDPNRLPLKKCSEEWLWWEMLSCLGGCSEAVESQLNVCVHAHRICQSEDAHFWTGCHWKIGSVVNANHLLRFLMFE